MDTSLRLFIRQFLGVVLMTLVPVILTAFLSLPYILRFHPGEDRGNAIPVARHMT
jgi:hypothetical protein